MDVKRTEKRNYYTEGNVVRTDWAVEKPQESEKTVPLTREEYIEKKKKEQGSRLRLIEKTRKERQSGIDLPSMIFLAGAIALTLYICVSYLSVQSEIMSNGKKIASLETKLMSLKNDNRAEFEKIQTSVDLTEVYKVATQQLGMKHARKDQIILFDSVKTGYVRRYAGIPEVASKSVIDKFFK